VGSAVVIMGGRSFADHDECRQHILRELDLHGGSPSRVAEANGMTLVLLQNWIAILGLRGEARRARDRWARMFRLGGNDGAGE